MAKNTSVWLGFLDTTIPEGYAVDFKLNKVGGKPQYALEDIENPVCPLCQLPQLLVVQIYAPLECNSHHRTLYLFCCVNSSCWNESKSWTCLRVQSMKEDTHTVDVTPTNQTEWCNDADNWDDSNGNAISSGNVSNDDEESCTPDDSLQTQFGALSMDHCNANTDSQGAAAVYENCSISAEIEADEGQAISIDTPIVPHKDLAAILLEDRNGPPLPSNMQFIPFFINVWEETSNYYSTDSHVRELVEDYQKENAATSPDNFKEDMTLEQYETSTPIHGDGLFHKFITKIQSNPGQIIRYSRNGTPLIINPLNAIANCAYCQGESVFEFQLLPTLIPKLGLIGDKSGTTRIEYGNVLVFTCKANCVSTQNQFKYEVVVVQSERF